MSPSVEAGGGLLRRVMQLAGVVVPFGFSNAF
jgi:hypothetical protein